jgi:hypothetical protein
LILLEAFTGLGRQVKRLLRDWSPLAEDHWHGVAADTFMSHLAMLQARPDGDPTPGRERSPTTTTPQPTSNVERDDHAVRGRRTVRRW